MPNKKKAILLLSLSFFFTHAFCQEWKAMTDSAKFYVAAKRTDKAIEFYLLAKQLLPRDSATTPTYVNLIQTTADLNMGIGQFAKALPLYAEGSSIIEKIQGKENPLFASLAYKQGLASFRLGRYRHAEHYFIESKEIRGRILDHTHTDYTGSCIALANVYNTTGKYEEAELMYLEAKSILEIKPGIESDNYARVCNNLSSLNADMGQFEKAEPLAIQAREIRGRVLARNNPYYAISCINLANLYRDIGQYEKAEPLYLEAKQIREQMEPLGQHPEYAASCNILADLYSYMREYKKAEQLYLTAKDIREKLAPAKEHIDYAESCNNLAQLYSEMKNYKKAEELSMIANAIWKKQLGEDDPTYAIHLNNLGTLYYEMGDYDRAATYYEQAHSLWEKLIGKDHIYYAQNAANLARIAWNKGQLQKANELFKESYKIQLAQINKLFRFSNESGKLSFLKNVTGSADQFQSFYYDKRDQLNPVQAYTLSVSNRHLVLSSTREVREIIYKSNDVSLIAKYEEWARLKRQLANLYAKNRLGQSPLIKEYEQNAEELEKQLSKSSAGFQKAMKPVDWSQIRESLNPGEAAIEFAEFNYYNGRRWTDSTYYVALVMRKDKVFPSLVPLFEKKKLDELLRVAGTEGQTRINIVYNQGALSKTTGKNETFYDLAWQPLEKYLTGISTVYYAPAGNLYRVSFAALSGKDKQYISEKYKLVQLNSTADITDPQKIKLENKDQLVLYGGIEFDVDSTALKNAVSILNRQKRFTSSIPGDLARGAGDFTYLPATKIEVESIKKMADSRNLKATILEGLAASEESFKDFNIKNTPAVLHIATHGFFSRRTDKVKTVEAGTRSSSLFTQSDDPLFRSGLVMAGGRNSWRGRTIEGLEDGLLTAYEISGMYLPATKLAVLSACESALGDIEGSEGVFGLQRAFKLAGVQNLVMSLWAVPDKPTSEFMEAFYSNIMSGITIQDAFYQAQGKMRNLYKSQPYNWAAWILIR